MPTICHILIFDVAKTWIMLWNQDMGVSENGGTPKSSILIGISIINHPFWGTPIWETPISPQIAAEGMDTKFKRNVQPSRLDLDRLPVQKFIQQN